MGKEPSRFKKSRPFIESYLVDHFAYKAQRLSSEIAAGAPPALPGRSEAAGPESRQWFVSCKLEIRATYLQAIEALFELVYALYPRNSEGTIDFGAGQIRDDDIWLNVSRYKSSGTYAQIHEIGVQGRLPFDDWRVGYVESDTTASFLRHVFYYGLLEDDETKRSLPAIRIALVTLAKEFNSRKDYNAFKHGMRLVPMVGKIAFWTEGGEERAEYDLEHSATYLDPYDPGGVARVTRPLDFERDLRMLKVCHALISNIIRSRRRSIGGLGPQQLFVLDRASWTAAERRATNLAEYVMVEPDDEQPFLRLSYYLPLDRPSSEDAQTEGSA